MRNAVTFERNCTQTGRQTDRQTDKQNDYYNPSRTCELRVNNQILHPIVLALLVSEESETLLSVEKENCDAYIYICIVRYVRHQNVAQAHNDVQWRS